MPSHNTGTIRPSGMTLYPPDIPPDAPVDVRDFVGCRGTTAELRPGELWWLPMPEALKDAPTPAVSFEHGATPGSVDATISVGDTTMKMPVSVKDGELSVDTSGITLPGPDVFHKPADLIRSFVSHLNFWLKGNQWQFGPLTLKRGVVTLTKIPYVPPSVAGAEQPPASVPGRVKTAAAAGAFLLGAGTGTLLGVNVDSRGELQQPSDSVATAAVPSGPFTFSTALPEGGVDASLIVTPVGTDATLPLAGHFAQDGASLTFVVPGLAPFVGTIDASAAFDVRNDVGSFVGQFSSGDQVEGDHEYQGERFTFTGTLSDSYVVDDTGLTYTFTIRDNVRWNSGEPVAGESVGALGGWGLAASAGTALVGTGLVAASGRRKHPKPTPMAGWDSAYPRPPPPPDEDEEESE